MCGPRACCVNSLSRDGDNGTSDLFNRWREACSFLFAVAKGGQRNTKEKIATAIELAFLFAVARWGQRNLTFVEMQPDYTFLFTVARWGQRNLLGEAMATPMLVSIRCREMGTAEPGLSSLEDSPPKTCFLFAVARWGQRNSSGWADVILRNPAGFLFAVARWGQRNPGSGTVKAWPDQGFYSLSRDGDSGTPGQPGLVGSEGGFYSLSHRKGVHL